MTKVKLVKGEYEDAAFDDFLVAVLVYNQSIGRGHLMSKRDSRRIYMVCSTGSDNCAFRAYASKTPLKNGIKVTRFIPHTCTEGRDIKRRQYNSSQIEHIAKCVDSYIPEKGKTQVNASELQSMVKKETGISITQKQARLIVRKKTDESGLHFAQYRFLKSYVDGLRRHDPSGVYQVNVKQGEPDQFESLFIMPSRVMKNWKAHNGYIATFAMFMEALTGGVLHVIACYDSNNMPTLLAFAILPEENATNWCWFLTTFLEKVGGVKATFSDGAEGLNSEIVQDLLCKHSVAYEPCTYRLGSVTSNACELIGNILGEYLQMPIIDLITSLTEKMSSTSAERFRIGEDRLDNEDLGSFLTPYAETQHRTTLSEASGLIASNMGESEYGEHTFIVRKQERHAGYVVLVKESDMRFSCACRQEEEFLRPCAHVISTLLSINSTRKTNMLDVWDKRMFGTVWTTQYWVKQHKSGVCQKIIDGSQLNDMNLIPAEITQKKGRKRKWPYQPRENVSRKCASCGKYGHYQVTCPSPKMKFMVTSHAKETAKATTAFISRMTREKQ